MTSPWDDKQKPNEKSPHHGKRDPDDGEHGGHGAHEHGLGGKKPDKPDKAPKLKDLLVAAGATPDLIALAEAPDDVPMAAAFPSYWYQPNQPPILDQGDSPMCVAFSNARDQAHMDRPEGGKFYSFDEAKFFARIGGGPGGAYLTAGLDERKSPGYPVASGGGEQYHRISGYWSVDKTVNAVKAALTALPANGGVIFLLPWYHSWFHPFASGKLPAPDYLVGYHAIDADGWNDNIGIRLPNSWGTAWGVGGRCYLPYAYIGRAIQIFRTKDT